MTIVLTLPPEVEMILQNRAHHQGQDIAIIVLNCLNKFYLFRTIRTTSLNPVNLN
jgi:hypothetical protein